MHRAAVAVILGIAASAWASEPAPYHAEDPTRWGSPRRVLPPEYPPAAMEKGLTGYVDMEGVVTPFTTFDVQAYTPDREASRVFVEPLKAAVKHWTFYSAVGNDCQPNGERTVVRVWFEIDGGKPKLSVSTRPRQPRENPRVLKAVERSELRYPESMLRDGLQAYVYARVVVTPDGDVREATSVAYPNTQDRRAFVRATDAAMKRWKYPPAQGPDRVVCHEVVYRIRD